MSELATGQQIRLTLPIPPSVNHCYFTKSNGQRILKKEAKHWIAQAQMIGMVAKGYQAWQFSENEKLIMELTVYWQDKRRRDMSNLHKLIADSLEGVLYADDKWLLIRDIDFDYDKANPRVEMVVRHLDEN